MRAKLQYSNHAMTRMAQRNLSTEAIEYTVTYGQRFHNAGAIHCFLGKKDIPKFDRKHDQVRRLEGTVVLLDPKSDTVITVYRNKDAPLEIRRKAKYNLKSARYVVYL